MTTSRQSVTLRAKRDDTGSPLTGGEPRKQLTIRLPADVHRALKIRVAEEGRNMAELIERLIREYLVGSRQA